MKKTDILKLGVFIIICETAGVIGSFFTAPAIGDWYGNLAKPALSPPNWIFAPVWITLYALMGIAVFLVWRAGWERKDIKIALGIFGVQLILNSAWSVIFFGLKNPGWAFAEIILLWLAILAVMISFWKISRPAAWLLLPYILWISFAGYLNFAIWQENNGAAVCTIEAKLCPDGSYVGRNGPKCEFTACPEPNIVGGDKDSHGCIGLAGYSWCDAKQKCLRVFEEDCADRISELAGKIQQASGVTLFSKGEASFDWLAFKGEKTVPQTITGFGYRAERVKRADYDKVEKFMNDNYEQDINNMADGVDGGHRAYRIGYAVCALDFSYDQMKTNSEGLSESATDSLSVDLTCGYFNSNNPLK